MSQIYINEPPINGKVLLKTTMGDVDVELWSKETPLACRNFVQLCMEGYYNGNIFHRIVRDFIAQSGDPTGTGEGGESVYGHTFKDEFHSRLRFTRRGLVGMANASKDDNSSQFFFTLGRADELTNKHTLFGKVSGPTLYNMLRLNDVSTNMEDHPLDPPKILKTEVLSNPFDDIVPRVDSRRLDKRKEKAKSQSKATKNFTLLSFGEEAEEDEEETAMASRDLKIKSSHDVLTDSKLSTQPAVDQSEVRRRGKRKNQDGDDGGEGENGEEGDSNKKPRLGDERKLSVLEERLMREEQEKMEKKKALRDEAAQLKRELREAKRKREAEKEEREAQERELPEVVRDLRKEMAMYKSRKGTIAKGGDREGQTMDMLSKFKSRLFSARFKDDADDEPHDDHVTNDDKPNENPKDEWLTHHLRFETDDPVLAKDANVQNEDTFDIYDPRNPLNKRRREADKIEMQNMRKGREKRT